MPRRLSLSISCDVESDLRGGAIRLLMKMTLLMDNLIQKRRLAPEWNMKNLHGHFFPYVDFMKAI